jgi:very-short-patch-repair endonuclease
MPPKKIVIGQRVNPQKVQRAKELRRQMTPEEKILWRALRTKFQ